MSQPAIRLPSWVQRGKLAYHVPSKILFWIGDCQQNADGHICLCDFSQGRTGTRYLLDECEPGNLHHFKSVGLVSLNGTLISTVREQVEGYSYVVFSTDDREVRVKLNDPNAFCNPDLTEAANTIAQFFPGSAIGRYEEVG